uniref:SGNH hydrolase-type esterase domain-containing protein n=1 Tax=Clytia hemisphaerica TaxID=252671 RepID=A0A7M5X0D2_9CNID
MADGRMKINFEEIILKKLMNQSHIELVKEGELNESCSDDIKSTMDFIDQMYVESEVKKASDNLNAFICDEIKKSSGSKPQQGNEDTSGFIKCKDKMINILENQIIFYEEEIRRKNNLIDSLLQGCNTHQNISFFRKNCENVTHHPIKSTCDAKRDVINNEKVTIRNDKENLIGKSISHHHSLNTSVNGFQREKEKVNENNPPKRSDIDDIKLEQKKREMVYICGDSIVNGVDGDGVSSKDFCTVVKSFSGSTSKDMIDYVRPTARKKPNKIIIHVGTNDIIKGINDTTDNLQTIIETVREISPETQICFSELCLRTDVGGRFTKVGEKNKELRKFCSERNIGLVENGNVDHSCLARKKLHMNPKGLKTLALNFKSFLAKC